MKIGIDLDSVVADIMTPLIDFHNQKYQTNTKLSDHTTFSIEKIWKCTEAESIDRIHEFYQSSFVNKIKPVPGSLDGIKFLSNTHEITNRWIDQYFPNIFKTINHTNQSGKIGGKKIKKSEVAEKLKINLFIDDHLDFAYDCASLGIKILLMDMPWNQIKKLPKNIVRVSSWKEIVNNINK